MAFRIMARTILELGAELISSDGIAPLRIDQELSRRGIQAGAYRRSGARDEVPVRRARRAHRLRARHGRDPPADSDGVQATAPRLRARKLGEGPRHAAGRRPGGRRTVRRHRMVRGAQLDQRRGHRRWHVVRSARRGLPHHRHAFAPGAARGGHRGRRWPRAARRKGGWPPLHDAAWGPAGGQDDPRGPTRATAC